MEALPPDSMLAAFNVPFTNSPNDYAKLADITPTTGVKWTGTFIVTIDADWYSEGIYEPGIAIITININTNGDTKTVLNSGGTIPWFMFALEDNGSGNTYTLLIHERPDVNKLGCWGNVIFTSDSNAISYYKNSNFGYLPSNSVSSIDENIYRDGGAIVITDTNKFSGSSRSIINIDGRLATYGNDLWHSPTFQNGWGNTGGGYAAAGYRKMPDGRIEIRGLVSGGTLDATIFTLPVGYRPTETRMFTAVQGDGSPVRINVSSSGAISTYNASNNAYQSLEISFYP